MVNEAHSSLKGGAKHIRPDAVAATTAASTKAPARLIERWGVVAVSSFGHIGWCMRCAACEQEHTASQQQSFHICIPYP